MTVQMCLLTDTRSPADNPKFLYVWPVNDFTDSDGKGWSGRSKFDYTANSLGSDAQVPRKDSNGSVVLWRLRRIMGSGTRSWPEDLSDLTAGVALDAATAALDDIVTVPGSPILSVPMVTRALLNGVEIDPDVEGVLNLGNLSTTTALSAETSRAIAAEAANATAITSEASTARAAESAAQTTANAALPKAGGTMTGAIVLSGNPSTGLQAAPKQYVDSGDGTTLTTAQSYTDGKISALVGAAPSALDTLKEIDDQLASDEGVAAALAVTVGTKSISLTRTAVKTANYTAGANELVPVDTTSGTVTVTLPNAPVDKSRVVVKHIIQGGTNTATVACAGSDVFNKTGGATTATLSLLAQALMVQYDAGSAVWTVTSDDLPLSQLDLRYESIATYDVRAYGFHTATTDAGRTAAFAAACADACAAKLARGLRAEVYVPAGSWTLALSSGAWVLLTAGIRIRGHGRGYTTLKLTAGSGNYSALIVGTNAATTDLSDLELTDLTIDYNGNLAANQAALDAGPRRAVHVGLGSNVAVRRCKFLNIEAVQTVFLSGAGGLSHVTVEDCIFSLAAASFWHDHSSVYTHTAVGGTGATIRDNVFLGNSSLGARTAIETHGDGQQVTGNRVYNYAKGGNLTGISDPATQQVVWSDNVFHAVSAGIYVWSDSYNSSTDPGLTDVDIHDNLITIDVDTWNTNFGVNGATGIYYARTGAFGTRNVSIHDNTIRLLPFTATLASGNNHSHGISWSRTASVTDVNLCIYDNVIDGAIACGIGVEGGTQVGGGIWNNSILNPGKGAASGGFSTAFTAGIFASSALQHVRIEGNRIRDDQTTSTMVQPINLSSIAAGSTGVRVVGNRSFYSNGTAVAQVKSSTTSGLAVYAEYETGAYVAPTGNFEVGSKIVDRTTGLERRQQTAANGTNWLRSKSPDTAATIVVNANAGTGGSATISGNDKAGTITIITGTTPAAGVEAAVTFANAYSAAPVVSVTAQSSNGTGRGISGTGAATTGFNVNFANAPAASTTYTLNYTVDTGA